MSRPKKILYLHAGAELYGSDKILLEIVSGINKKDFEPIVCLPEKGPLVEKLIENKIQVLIVKYPILRRQFFTPIGIIKYIYNYRKYSKQLVNIVKEEKIYTLHVNTAAVLEGIYIKRKLKKDIRLIWHIHEILEKPRIVAKIINSLIVSKSDKIICVSEAVKKNLKSNSKKILVVHNGINNADFKKTTNKEKLRKELGINSNAIVVGMVGRINAWKGQEDFVEAFKIAKNGCDNIEGVIIGDAFRGQEWRYKQLEEKIAKDGLEKQLHLNHFRNDIEKVYNILDIFVLPSTNPDPLPTVVLEAMASNKPIIGYRHGGICEMVENNRNGILVTPCNQEDLGEAILKLANSKELRELYGKNSQDRQLKLFSKESFIKNFENIYNEGINEKQS